MQDAYLLDTVVASIAWDGGNPGNAKVRQKLAELGESQISICVVTLGEVLYGLKVSPGIDKSRHEAVMIAMRQYFAWDINKHVANIYAALRGRLFEQYAPRNSRGRLTKKHLEELTDPTTAKELGIQENDLWIVSVAVLYDMVFITADRKLHPILQVAHQEFSYDRVEIWDMDSLQQVTDGNSD